MLNAFSVDVEDYYHVSAFDAVLPRDRWPAQERRVAVGLGRVLDALARHHVRGTFFILGAVAEERPDLVRRIAAAGHEVGCHSHDHRLVYDMDPTAFREDVRRNKDVLEQLTGAPVGWFRAPSFSITVRSLWALDVLAELGFTGDSSVAAVRHDRYGIPDAPPGPYRLTTRCGSLVEVPPSTADVGAFRLPVAGGGYFRLYPFALTAWGIRAGQRAGRFANVYLHPWELDPDQPRFPNLSTATALRHYVGLRTTAAKLERLLTAYQFGTLTEAVADAAARGPLPEYAVRHGRLSLLESAA